VKVDDRWENRGVRDQVNVVGSRSVCDIDTMTLAVFVCGGVREKKEGRVQGYMGWYNTRREVRVLSDRAARHEGRA
jgi:hypothetical protein